MSRERLEKGSVEELSGPERAERVRVRSRGGEAKICWTEEPEDGALQSCRTLERQTLDPPTLGWYLPS